MYQNKTHLEIISEVHEDGWYVLEKAITQQISLIAIGNSEINNSACFATDPNLSLDYRVGFSRIELRHFLIGYLAVKKIKLQSIGQLLTLIQEIKVANADEFWSTVENGKMISSEQRN